MSDSGSQVRQTLKANFLFRDLTDFEITALAERIWLEDIPSGSTIVTEDELADALYMVVDGGVNVVKGKNQFLSYLGKDGFFGEMALFTDEARRSASCVAAMDSTCAIIRKAVLEEFADAVPTAGVKIYRAIIKALAERLQATSADLATLMGSQIRGQSEVSAMVEAAKNKDE